MPKPIGNLCEKGYSAADIHIHSSIGDGMADIPEILEFVAEKTDLAVIAITDHDNIEGSYQAGELAAKRGYHFEVVTGMEVTTLDGHLLALFLETPVKSFQAVDQTIEAIHAQGGLCIAPHPMSWLTSSLLRQTLERIIASSDRGIYLDGIEIINGSIAGRVGHRKAKLFREKHGLAATGGSDAHFLVAIGSALTLFPGRSAAELKQAILERKTEARNGIPARLTAVGLSQIIKQQRKSGGPPIGTIVRNLWDNLHEDRSSFPL